LTFAHIGLIEVVNEAFAAKVFGAHS
jgi:hypothetical protein